MTVEPCAFTEDAEFVWPQVGPIRWGEALIVDAQLHRDRLPSKKEGKNSKCFAERRLRILSPEISPSVVPKLYRNASHPTIHSTRAAELLDLSPRRVKRPSGDATRQSRAAQPPFNRRCGCRIVAAVKNRLHFCKPCIST